MYSRETLEQLTFRYERLRGSALGVAQSGLMTIGLLVAIRVYEAPALMKATLPAAHSLGLLISPVCLAVLSRTPWRSTGLCASFLAISALAILLAAICDSLIALTLLLSFALIIQAQQPPLMIQVYSTNYRAINRGSRMSVTVMLSGLFGSVFLYLCGNLLDDSIGYWRWLFTVMAVASLIAAGATFLIPSRPMDHFPRSRVLENLTLITSDKVFGILLASWMLLGMATLMTSPLRIEYLANPDYGINATNEQVALLTFIIPAAAQILSTRFWGHIYDRVSFIALRNCINVCFLASILLYFTTRSLTFITISSILYGIATGGSSLVWNLWVIKMAPAHRVQAYMSIHTWTTGLRGVIAPFIGFYLLTVVPATAIAMICAILLGLSMLLFITAKDDPRLR